jgi:hypothetical protein
MVLGVVMYMDVAMVMVLVMVVFMVIIILETEMVWGVVGVPDLEQVMEQVMEMEVLLYGYESDYGGEYFVSNSYFGDNEDFRNTPKYFGNGNSKGSGYPGYDD